MRYEDDFGNEFTEDEAIDNLYETMDIDDYVEYLSRDLGFYDLIEWGLRNNEFLEHFNDQIEAARQEYFTEHYFKIEEEEEEEE